MNRRGFFARAAAVGAGILASCSPKMVGLAQAQGASIPPTGPDEYDQWKDTVGGLPPLKAEVLHELGPDVGKAWDQHGRMWRINNAYGRVIAIDRSRGEITVEWAGR